MTTGAAERIHERLLRLHVQLLSSVNHGNQARSAQDANAIFDSALIRAHIHLIRAYTAGL